MAARPIVVMKFGGTSVAERAGRAALAARVQAALESGRAPVVVVSAMGRNGAPYATDTLLGLVDGLPQDPRERDLIASCGEVISTVVIAHELRAAGISAQAFTGAEAGILTDAVHGAATVEEVHPGDLLASIGSGHVPVVAGFQGVTGHGEITTLGRGGSDTTACALGVALEAEAVEIYTDVDGVMSADPRACERASVLTSISANELYQMARHGSKVVHTPAAELALSSGLALRVRNTFSTNDGTLVRDLRTYAPSGVATAVAHTADIARITVTLPAAEGSAEHMDAQTRVYRAMADAGVSLDMFTPVGRVLTFTVPETHVSTATDILTGQGLDPVVRRDCAKVTLVGAGMHGVPGVMARLAEYLADAGVDILQAADSHTTISVLVPGTHAHAAVGALHRGFELDHDAVG